MSAAASPRTRASHDYLRAGSAVRIFGLVSAPELNGSCGQCKEFVPSSGRWIVRLRDSGVCKALRPINLAPAGAEGGPRLCGYDSTGTSFPDYSSFEVMRESLGPGDAIEQEELIVGIADLLEGRDLGAVTLGQLRTELEARFNLGHGALVGRRQELAALAEAEVLRVREDLALGPLTVRSSEAAAEAARPSSVPGRADPEPELPAAKRLRTASREEFRRLARPLHVELGGQELDLEPAVSATGACGFRRDAEIRVGLDGESRAVRCRITCIVEGSEEWPEAKG